MRNGIDHFERKIKKATGAMSLPTLFANTLSVVSSYPLKISMSLENLTVIRPRDVVSKNKFIGAFMTLVRRS